MAPRATYPRRREPARRHRQPASVGRRPDVRRRPRAHGRDAAARPRHRGAPRARGHGRGPPRDVRPRRAARPGLCRRGPPHRARPDDQPAVHGGPDDGAARSRARRPGPGRRHRFRLPGRRAGGDGLPGHQRGTGAGAGSHGPRAPGRAGLRRPGGGPRRRRQRRRARAAEPRTGSRAAAEPATAGEPAAAWPRIIVAAAAPDVPEALLARLADGGRLVIPVGGRDVQVLVLVERDGAKLHTTRHGACIFVPLLGEGGFS